MLASPRPIPLPNHPLSEPQNSHRSSRSSLLLLQAQGGSGHGATGLAFASPGPSDPPPTNVSWRFVLPLHTLLLLFGSAAGPPRSGYGWGGAITEGAQTPVGNRLGGHNACGATHCLPHARGVLVRVPGSEHGRVREDRPSPNRMQAPPLTPLEQAFLPQLTPRRPRPIPFRNPIPVLLPMRARHPLLSPKVRDDRDSPIDSRGTH